MTTDVKKRANTESRLQENSRKHLFAKHFEVIFTVTTELELISLTNCFTRQNGLNKLLMSKDNSILISTKSQQKMKT